MASPDENPDDPILVVVLVDTNGNFYELSHETLQRSKVPEEPKQEVRDAIADTLSVSSYINNPRIPGSIIGSFVVKPPMEYAGSYLTKRSSQE